MQTARAWFIFIKAAPRLHKWFATFVHNMPEAQMESRESKLFYNYILNFKPSPLQEAINELSRRPRKTLIKIIRDIKICPCISTLFVWMTVFSFAARTSVHFFVKHAQTAGAHCLMQRTFNIGRSAPHIRIHTQEARAILCTCALRHQNSSSKTLKPRSRRICSLQGSRTLFEQAKCQHLCTCTMYKFEK